MEEISLQGNVLEVTVDMIQIWDWGVGIMNQEVSNCLAQTAHYHTWT